MLPKDSGGYNSIIMLPKDSGGYNTLILTQDDDANPLTLLFNIPREKRLSNKKFNLMR